MRTASYYFVLLCSLAFAGTATAQNAQSSAAIAVNERVAAADRDRLQWEAAQMWGAPAIPFREAVRTHTVQINTAMPLTVPRLRREWLQRSSDAEEERTSEDAQSETSRLRFAPKAAQPK